MVLRAYTVVCESVHPAVDTGCVRLSAAVNIGMHVSSGRCFGILAAVCPAPELPDRAVILFIIPQGAAVLFSTGATARWIPVHGARDPGPPNRHLV